MQSYRRHYAVAERSRILYELTAHLPALIGLRLLSILECCCGLTKASAAFLR
jgi:hypothetical protein